VYSPLKHLAMSLPSPRRPTHGADGGALRAD